MPSPDDAASFVYTDADRAVIAEHTGGVVVGSPDTVRKRLQAVLADTGADELMVTTPVYDHDDRRHSYELISDLARSLS